MLFIASIGSVALTIFFYVLHRCNFYHFLSYFLSRLNKNLNNEINTRANSDANLQNQIWNKVKVNNNSINLAIAYGSVTVPFATNVEKDMRVGFENGYAFPSVVFLVIPILTTSASTKYQVAANTWDRWGFTLRYNTEGLSGNAQALNVNYIAFGW